MRLGRHHTSAQGPVVGSSADRGLRQALWAVILITGAFLAIVVTLPLLGRSTISFAIVATLCWGAVFGGAIALTRNNSRKPTATAPDDPAPEAAVGDHAPLIGAADLDS
jgi:predicted MFS family arabinose efflux permease